MKKNLNQRYGTC